MKTRYVLLVIASILVLLSVGDALGQGSMRWVPSNGRIPNDSIVGGEERDGTELYICRTTHSGTTLPGKVVGDQCNYNWGTREYTSRNFEVLVGGGDYWTADLRPRTAVVGGSNNEQYFYVCRATASGGTHPGRLQDGKCNYSFGGRGYASNNFEVLNGRVAGGAAGAVSLLDAAAEGEPSQVRAALRAGQAINQKNTKGQTALIVAASKGFRDVVRILLDEGATVDVRDNDGFTALAYAAYAGDASSVRLLLRSGANLATRTNSGYTPLYWAAASGSVETVQAITNDPGYQRLGERGLGFPLHGAAAYDRVEVLEYLINEEEFDVNQLDSNGYTPIMTAARNNKAGAARALIGADADLTLRTPNNHDVFSLAAISDAVNAMGVLLNTERFGIRSASVESGFRVAARESKQAALNFLLQRGVDPNATLLGVGTTALMLAAQAGHDDAVKILLRASAKLDPQNDRGETALILAAAAGKKDVVKLLLQAGADPSIADQNGKTALDHAIQNRHGDTRKELEKASRN